MFSLSQATSQRLQNQNPNVKDFKESLQGEGTILEH